MKAVVIADFANEYEYRVIKVPHGTAAPTLEKHRELLAEAIKTMTEQGDEVAVEICDLAGYKSFCELQHAVNTPATVAAYVLTKHGGVEKRFQSGLEHQNITIFKD